MANPLTSAPAPSRKSSTNGQAHCPDGYASPHAWCAWRNREMERDDVLWIVGPAGTPILVDDESVCARRAKDSNAQIETERQRFNWRLQHPVTEGAAA